jgi:hypothetical protein
MISNNSRKQYDRYVKFHFCLYRSMTNRFFFEQFFAGISEATTMIVEYFASFSFKVTVSLNIAFFWIL